VKIDLTGKRILVTGASRGIGRAIAEGLAECGGRVGAHYRERADGVDALIGKFGERVVPLRAELAEAGSAVGLFREAREALGGLDVLVNNAGVASSASFDLSDEAWVEAWDYTQAVNLRAAALLCREAVKHFAETGGGRIVNVASRAAFRGDVPDYLAYAASKGGLVALTRSIARGFGKRDVKAFVVAPGFVRTDMAQQFFDEFGEEAAVRELALPRMTEPEDLAPIVALLASGLADHATGCTIDINAGSYVR
jgi:NAD(P)-dependent dehydrogenase (short-subunit alcohol dehydrogenase family)